MKPQGVEEWVYKSVLFIRLYQQFETCMWNSMLVHRKRVDKNTCLQNDLYKY